MFTRLAYNVRQAFAQIGRNKAMSLTAVLAITAMMLILGLFFTTFVNVDMFANVIKQDYNVVEVYLDEGIKDAGRQNVEKSLKAIEGVSSLEYRNKDDALEIMKGRWGSNGYLLENLESNPLPDSYIVYVDDKETADRVSQEAPNIKGIDDITYYQDTINKLAKITNFISFGSIVVMIFLVIVSIIIVSNTIKLTVFNRSKEIGIMKYLGATDWFVRSPFIVEGITLGFVSALIATGLVYVSYNKVTEAIGGDIMRILSMPVVSVNYLIVNLLIIFLALGVGIGTCGSIISIRRFLDR